MLIARYAWPKVQSDEQESQILRRLIYLGTLVLLIDPLH